MLKRQRPSSPPPLPTFLIDDDDQQPPPALKRRRTTPQPLTSAGQMSSSAILKADDDAATHPNSEYKAVNSLLYELHTLHRHRLLFLHHDQPPDESQPTLPVKPGPRSQMASQRSVGGGHELGDIGNTMSTGYEDANKLLGSSFLLRRRQLHSGT